jgi:uncharacterized repeat protein (TIGR04138 family)
MSIPESSLWDAIDRIRERDPRYAREAYGFVVVALGAVVRAFPPERQEDPARRHLSGHELLIGVVQLARSEFGSLAPTVFREWGVLQNEDVGRIVFDLVNAGQLSAREQDTIEDFRDGPDLLREMERPDPPNPRERPRAGGARSS